MYSVVIRKNETGELRLRHVDLDWEDGSYWFWTEGNFGCDCNRELEWLRACGEEDDETWDKVECGHYRYSVIYAILPDNTVILFQEEVK